MSKARAKADGIPVYCRYDEIIDIDKLVANPRNPNKHGTQQIEMLAKIIENQGWRSPITVSNLSGFITKGHGRLQAAQLKGFKEVPVEYQDYKNPAAEWADIIADNKIQSYSELDELAVKEIIIEIDSEIDITLTGYEEEIIEQMMTGEGENDPHKEWEGMPEFNNEKVKHHQILIVYFENEEAVKDFQQKIKQTFTEKTKYIYHPKQIKDNEEQYRYTEE